MRGSSRRAGGPGGRPTRRGVTASSRSDGRRRRAGATRPATSVDAMGHARQRTTPCRAARRPTATCPAKLDETLHVRRRHVPSTASGPGRSSRSRNEATWTGHVGVGAKAETFDVAFRGELSIQSGVEIAATGKVLKRNPDPHLPQRADQAGRAGEVRTSSPCAREFDAAAGRRASAATPRTSRPLTALADDLGCSGLSDIQSELEKGDKRWYDAARLRARSTSRGRPRRSSRAGAPTGTLWVIAQDGTRAADARWASASGCGALSVADRERRDGPVRRRGRGRRRWEPGPPAPASVGRDHVHGRAAAAAPPLDPAAPKPTRYRYDIRVDVQEGHGRGHRPDERDRTRPRDRRPRGGLRRRRGRRSSAPSGTPASATRAGTTCCARGRSAHRWSSAPRSRATR